MTDEIIGSKTAADESSLPFFVLLPRAVVAMIIGGFAGWFLSTIWCYNLGRLLFPSIFPNGTILKAASQSVFLTALAGVFSGLVSIYARGNKWTRAFATVLSVWLGATVFFVNALMAIVFIVFLCTKIPSSPPTPPPKPTDIQFAIWTTIPALLSGSALLFAVFKMHVSDSTAWLRDTKVNFAETCAAIFKPQQKHQLERFVLQSPLSLEECRARLPQIADVDPSIFAFWRRLPLPGFNPLIVKVEGNQWSFKSAVVFDVELTGTENGTQLKGVPHWLPVMKYWLLLFGGFYALWSLGLLFMAFGGFVATFIQEPSIFSFIGGLLYAFAGFLIWLASWLYFRLFWRGFLWQGRKQQLMVINAFEQVLQAQIIERETVHYKWGLFEEKSESAPTAS